jgi:exopolysaccharide biosynthesis polyprenyl glycosylphosphotransferase
LVIAVAVKVSSPGPVFFSQERVGKNRRLFRMYKFRSMKVSGEDTSDTKWTTPEDARKTKVGTFLRKTSLDELPQFINVLIGDMSIIGPRPERPYFVEQFKEDIPKYMVKHRVRPGITGWAQINGWRGDTSIEERIKCDIDYIENWTFGLDLKIVLKTIVHGFVNKNAY